MVTTTPPKRYSWEDAQAILAKYKEYSFNDLHPIFKEGKTPTFYEIEGDVAGNVSSTIWNPEISRRRRFVLRIMQMSLDNLFYRWSGKRFVSNFEQGEKGRGNLLFRSRFISSASSFDTYIKGAMFDQDPCLALDYCYFPMSITRGIEDLRKIDDGVFLAQSYMKLPWDKEHVFSYYVVLCALEKGE